MDSDLGVIITMLSKGGSALVPEQPRHGAAVPRARRGGIFASSGPPSWNKPCDGFMLGVFFGISEIGKTVNSRKREMLGKLCPGWET